MWLGYAHGEPASATLADPEAPAVLVASDDGRPTYERMVYVAVERWSGWLRPAATSFATVTEVPSGCSHEAAATG